VNAITTGQWIRSRESRDTSRVRVIEDIGQECAWTLVVQATAARADCDPDRCD
jgi:hypothetical protein